MEAEQLFPAICSAGRGRKLMLGSAKPQAEEDSVIPHDKSAAVSRGLREAFGVTAFEDIRAITGRLSSDLLFRIVVRGSSFMLLVMPRMDEVNDPKRRFTCMKAAAEAGLAPHAWYIRTED